MSGDDASDDGGTFGDLWAGELQEALVATGRPELVALAEKFRSVDIVTFEVFGMLKYEQIRKELRRVGVQLSLAAYATVRKVVAAVDLHPPEEYELTEADRRELGAGTGVDFTAHRGEDGGAVRPRVVDCRGHARHRKMPDAKPRGKPMYPTRAKREDQLGVPPMSSESDDDGVD